MTKKERRIQEEMMTGMTRKQMHDFMKAMGPAIQMEENEHPELVRLARLARSAEKGNPKYAKELWKDYWSAVRCIEIDEAMLQNAY